MSRRPQITIKDLAVGSAIAAVTEPFVDTFAARFANFRLGPVGVDDLIKIGLGAYAMKKGKRMVKGIGMAYFIIGVRNVVKQVITGGAVGGAIAQNGGQAYQSVI